MKKEEPDEENILRDLDLFQSHNAPKLKQKSSLHPQQYLLNLRYVHCVLAEVAIKLTSANDVQSPTPGFTDQQNRYFARLQIAFNREVKAGNLDKEILLPLLHLTPSMLLHMDRQSDIRNGELISQKEEINRQEGTRRKKRTKGKRKKVKEVAVQDQNQHSENEFNVQNEVEIDDRNADAVINSHVIYGAHETEKEEPSEPEISSPPRNSFEEWENDNDEAGMWQEISRRRGMKKNKISDGGSGGVDGQPWKAGAYKNVLIPPTSPSRAPQPSSNLQLKPTAATALQSSMKPMEEITDFHNHIKSLPPHTCEGIKNAALPLLQKNPNANQVLCLLADSYEAELMKLRERNEAALQTMSMKLFICENELEMIKEKMNMNL